MSSRKSLELRAAAVNIDATLVPNDSVLEQKVIYAELQVVASTTATQKLPTANALTETGGANV